MLTDKPSWVAVMTHLNSETLVAGRFRDADPPIECYLPMIARKDKRNTKAEMVEKPMFPSYLFAHINDKQIYKTRTTRGVIYIVSSQHSIITMRDSEIDAIRRFEATQRKIRIYETSQLKRGAKATILEGEFAGMEGTLVKQCKDGNFCVSIEVMNISIVVHVRRDEFRPGEKDGYEELEAELAGNEKSDVPKASPV